MLNQKDVWNIDTMAALAAGTVTEQALWLVMLNDVHCPCQVVSAVIGEPPSVALLAEQSETGTLSSIMNLALEAVKCSGRMVTTTFVPPDPCVLLTMVTNRLVASPTA